MNQEDKRQLLSTAIAKRKHDYQLVLEIYCSQSGCSVREITIHVKDHDKTFVPHLRKRSLVCPVCGGTNIIVHGLETALEAERQDDASARHSVNRQMLTRDRMAQGEDCAFLTAAEFGDDRLPPTPPGWFPRPRS